MLKTSDREGLAAKILKDKEEARKKKDKKKKRSSRRSRRYEINGLDPLCMEMSTLMALHHIPFTNVFVKITSQRSIALRFLHQEAAGAAGAPLTHLRDHLVLVLAPTPAPVPVPALHPRAPDRDLSHPGAGVGLAH